MDDLYIRQLVDKIIVASYEVYQLLGNNYKEMIYRSALAYEFNERNIRFDRLWNGGMLSSDAHSQGTVRFFVEGVLVVEVRAVRKLQKAHTQQLSSYLKTYQKREGLLVNFGSASLQFERLNDASERSKSGK